MSLFPEILVCVDGSPASQAGLPAALALGKGNRLRGLFVMDRKVVFAHFLEDLAGATGLTPIPGAADAARQSLEQAGRALLESFTRSARKAGAQVETVTVEENVADGILAAAKQADLVVMGRKGAHGSARTPVGSNVERVVRNSPVPVLVVPGGKPGPYRRILAGYDDSEHGRETLILAGGIARHLDATLTLLHVNADEKAGRDALKLAGRMLKDREVPHKLVLKKGEPADVLSRIARKGETDLMVLGAYGAGYLKEFLLGSTTDVVLRETRIPLLIHR